MSVSASAHDRAVAEAPRRWLALSLLCFAVVVSMTTWFSATAVTGVLQEVWQLPDSVIPWLTNGVQIGFVVGALTASAFNLPDIVRSNRLMATSAAVAALANAVLLLHPSPFGLVAARVVTGVALAGVYPPALKLVSTWFVRGRGFALGAVIAALTLGSSLPHLVRALSTDLDWQVVVITASAATLLGALVFLFFAHEGPFPFGTAVFNPREMGVVLSNRPVMLATVGYLGHMWELYAMWAWLLVYAQTAFDAQSVTFPGASSLLTFAAIALGAPGCLIGGVLSDRIGRTWTTAGMMAVSGGCALVIGIVFHGPAWLFVLVTLVWGISVIGDSAQFSAAITELADRRYVGTALSIQLALGFCLTIVAIWMVPHVAAILGGWRWSFVTLAIGPLIGAAAMLALRRHHASHALAGGRR